MTSHELSGRNKGGRIERTAPGMVEDGAVVPPGAGSAEPLTDERPRRRRPPKWPFLVSLVIAGPVFVSAAALGGSEEDFVTTSYAAVPFSVFGVSGLIGRRFFGSFLLTALISFGLAFWSVVALVLFYVLLWPML